MALNIGSKEMCKQKKNSISLIVFLNIIQGTGTLCRACSFPLKLSKFLKVNLKAHWPQKSLWNIYLVYYQENQTFKEIVQ